MKILIPTNLSKSSQAAADFAMSFFGDRAQYWLLNSFPLMYRSGFYDSFYNYTPEHGDIPMEKLKRERKRLADSFGKQTVHLKALYGDPIKDIFNTTKEEQLDLIVLGYSSFKKWNDGLQYREKHALQHLMVPILLVPENVKLSSMKSIYYITDFSNATISNSLITLRYLARYADAGIKVFCFEHDWSNDIEKWTIDRFLQDAAHSFENITDEHDGLVKLQRELQLDENALVVFDFNAGASQGLKGLEQIIKHQSTIKPLLLMPQNLAEDHRRGA